MSGSRLQDALNLPAEKESASLRVPSSNRENKIQVAGEGRLSETVTSAQLRRSRLSLYFSAQKDRQVASRRAEME